MSVPAQAVGIDVGGTNLRALVAAEYTGAVDPFTITITREGKEIPVSPRRLLNGNIDPYLEPGDVVTIR